MRKITLGLTGQELGRIMNFEAITKLASKYGISNFEIWPLNIPGDGLGYRNRRVQEFAEMVRQNNIRIDCVTVEAAFVKEAVDDIEGYKDILRGAVDTAAEVGAGLVNHYCYFINLEEKPDFEKLDRYWGDVLDYAGKRNVKLVLENEAHDVTRHPETTAAIVEHFNDPFFRTNLDAVNYFHASEEAFPAAYEILKPYIGYVHLKNACMKREGSGQDRRDEGAPMSGIYEGRNIQYAPIPDGAVNIGGLITEILNDGLYQGTCTLEPHTVPERVEYYVKKETGWLKDHRFI